MRNVPDLAPLKSVLDLLWCIPFELNAKFSQNLMQVQITEAFEISYFDSQQHKFLRPKQDNALFAEETA